MSVYLDYNATAPIDSRVLEAMVDAYKNHYGNADSRTHDFGNDSREIVEKARGQVAQLLNVSKGEVFFTSGATESTNIAILGLQEYGEQTGKKHIVTTSIEHKAVINAARHLEKYGFSVECVSPDATGRISAEDVLNRVREDTLLVSVMHVNNETGVIQPVHEIGQALAKKNVLFHVDATQSCGKLVKELQTLNYNMLSIGAHKLSGPQGIGALILKKRRYKLPPVQAITFGGAQEHGLRPGTLPTALIAGMGKACEIALAEYEQNNAHCAALKEIVLQKLSNSGLKYEINGNPTYCVPNTINFSIDGISSEALMLASKQYCGISNGSACNSHDYSASYVLTSMKLNPDRIESAVRISWGPNIAPEVFAASIHELLSVAKEML